jgi:hypothetical protein
MALWRNFAEVVDLENCPTNVNPDSDYGRDLGVDWEKRWNKLFCYYIKATESVRTKEYDGLPTSSSWGRTGCWIFYPVSSPPQTTEGTVFYDSAAKKLKVYNGTSWETIQST